MSKVFVVNKGGHDLSKAEKYGELIYITEGMISKFHTTNMYRDAARLLKDSSPQDFILITGLAVTCSVICGCFAYKHGCLNLLLFKDEDYLVRRLDLKQLIDKEV